MLSVEARAFYEDYRRRHGELQLTAKLAEDLVRDALRDSGFHVHQIDGRAKDPASALRKIREKQYERPAEQLSDQIGVRVITYFQDQVDPITAELRTHFVVDEARSVDRRTALSVREFGYRSVHLIVQARLTGVEGPYAAPLREHWFEIQVRSLLEHAWAEIEHDLVYKSGVRYSEDFQRQLGIAAAQLEAIDGGFVGMRGERRALVEKYRATYQYGEDGALPLDAVRLAGLMEQLFPHGQSFETTTQGGASLPRNIDAICVLALRERGIETADLLRDALLRQEVQERIESYASLEGIAAEEVSHFAISVILAGLDDPEGFSAEYPDLVEDSGLRQSLIPDEADAYLDEEAPPAE